MRAVIGAMIGAVIPLFFIALSWLTSQQHEVVVNFINAAVPYVMVLAFAFMGAAIANAAGDDEGEN